MMTSRRLLNYLEAEPFQPFRIRMASGETFDIPHPEMLSVGRTTARVSVYSIGENALEQVRDREISVLLIESVEVEEPASQQEHRQNGNP